MERGGSLHSLSLSSPPPLHPSYSGHYSAMQKFIFLPPPRAPRFPPPPVLRCGIEPPFLSHLSFSIFFWWQRLTNSAILHVLEEDNRSKGNASLGGVFGRFLLVERSIMGNTFVGITMLSFHSSIVVDSYSC